MPASASGQRRKSKLDLHRIAAHAPAAAAAVAKRFVGALGSRRDRKAHPPAAFGIAESFCQRAHLGGPIGLRSQELMAASSAVMAGPTNSS